MQKSSSSRYQLCFRWLFQSGGGSVFPCDQQGSADLDDQSEKTRNNYSFASAMIGRDSGSTGHRGSRNCLVA